ncbi:Uncharacterized membrane protein, DUF106 family [Halomicrobium zhouii]|uniref:Uncharacterized membrane protein, DUF106 family n=1 Tax=Halomicrobium zhouii TaxID=767519 RepID=A0A1I6KBM7_9EURY|nr:EMC3/TMCO1 family protein [Halomicrobium zhouii]SFR88652.1 Uncharacterized membrane protein, DUF106 family [Halomicrobium zhouii]
MDSELRETVRDDEALAAALSTVLDHAEATDGTVTWPGVTDDVPAEQWGRLLETGLLVDAGECFVVDDPTTAREVVDDVEPDPDAVGAGADEPGDTSWSLQDKVAGVGALALMASYQIPSARGAVGSTMHQFLGPVEAALPFALTVALLAVVVGGASGVLNRRLRDTERADRVKARMGTIRDRLSDARDRGDEAAVERLEAEQRELMSDQLLLFKDMLRPMAYTVLLTAPVFLWLTWLAVAPAAAITPTATVFPFVGRIVWTARLLGPIQVWTVWYFVCSLVGGTAVRRAIGRVTAA